MSTPPRRSSRLSSVAAAAPAAAAVPAAPPAAAASSPSPQPGDKRRADDSADDSAAASSALADQQHASAAMSDVSDPAASAPSSSLLSPAPAASAAAAAASAPASAAAAAAASSSVDARKRHKQATDASSAVGSAAALPAAPSRWSHLYSDALHSILQFASLSELSHVLAVSRRWSDAVMTMPSIHATSGMGGAFNHHCMESPFLPQLLHPPVFPSLSSRLRRHVSSIGGWIGVAHVSEAVFQHLPWMSNLSLALGLHASSTPQRWIAALGRFTSLTNLEVDFGPQQGGWDARAFNSIVAAMAELPRLGSVSMELRPAVLPLLSFAPLIELNSLHALTVRSGYGQLPSCSDSQVAEFRSMRSLTALDVQTDRSAQTDFLVRLLQPGHALHLTELPSMVTNVTAPLAVVLGSLPSLTRLNTWLDCPHISLFSQLPQLTDVELRELKSASLDLDELVSGLSHCSKIRRLDLDRLQLTGSHLAKLLPCFPKLADLSLTFCDAVESLRCFDTPALAKSLTQLLLNYLRGCPASEVVHLLNLHSLRSISVNGLASPVGADLKAQFAVPSQRLPYLLSYRRNTVSVR